MRILRNIWLRSLAITCSQMTVMLITNMIVKMGSSVYSTAILDSSLQSGSFPRPISVSKNLPASIASRYISLEIQNTKCPRNVVCASYLRRAAWRGCRWCTRRARRGRPRCGPCGARGAPRRPPR